MCVGRYAIDNRSAGIGIKEAEAELLELRVDTRPHAHDDAAMQKFHRLYPVNK